MITLFSIDEIRTAILSWLTYPHLHAFITTRGYFKMITNSICSIYL